MTSDPNSARTPDLKAYKVTNYVPGGLMRRALWYVVSLFVFSGSWLPFYAPKRSLLRLFGARIGAGVVIKPRVLIKHPWRLNVGDYSWIGEGAWIDNLAYVDVGTNACISQDAYIMTGNHDYGRVGFDLITSPVRIGDGAWVGARAIVCPGVELGRNAVLAAGSVATRGIPENEIHAGNPAEFRRKRTIT